MNLPRPRFSPREPKKPRVVLVPVGLPQVIATTGSDGRISVIVDGIPVTSGPIARQAFGVLLDKIIRSHGTSLRVEVREADGTTYTDILTPAAIVNTASEPATYQSAGGRETPANVEVTGEGFLPGEDVAVAALNRHTCAGPEGHVCALVDAAELNGPDGVILFGRTSGMTVVVQASS